MSDIASLSFSIDTAQLNAADLALEKIAKTAAMTEAAISKMQATAATALKNVSLALGGGGGAAGAGLSAQVAEQQKLATSTVKATKAIESQATALRSATSAHAVHGAAARGNMLAMMEVEHVGRALFDSMAAGGSVIRTLLMESGRLQIAFENGLGGAFSSIAERVGGFVSPMNLGIGTVVGLGAAALTAVSRMHDLDWEMNRAVGGAGRFAGLSGAGLRGLAATEAEDLNVIAMGMGVQDTRTAAMAMARGRLDPSNMTSAMRLIPGYANLTNTSFGEAGDKLAGIFADPARGMGEMEKAVGALDDRTRQVVMSLTAQGNANAAARVLIDATSSSLNEMVKPQGPLDRLTTWWSNRNAQVEAGIVGLVRGPTADQQYRDASRMGGGRGMLGILQSRGLFDDGTGNLAEDFRHSAMLRGGSPIMRSEGSDLALNQQSQSAGDIVRSVLPELAERQRLTDQQANLSKALANPDVISKLGAGASDAFEALDRLNTALGTFKTGLQRLVEQGDLAVRQASARTGAEKAAVDAQRAYVTTLERTHSVLEAAQAAENSRNEAIAASTRTALEALRSTSDRAALVGLSPYDKMMRENDQRFRDMNERAITGPVAAGTAIIAPGVGMTNPGNIRNGPWAAGQPGYAGGGAFAAFDSPASGYRAANTLLDQYQRKGLTTPSQIINKWAPAGDHNDPVAYAATVRNLTGLDPDRPVPGTADARASLLYGMTRVEHGSSPYSRSDVAGMLDARGAVPGAAATTPVDPNSAMLANRVNYAVGRQADASDMLMSGPRQDAIQLQGQAAMLRTQQQVFGESTSAIAAATEKLKEWNAVSAAGVTQQKLQNDFGAAGAKMWADLTAQINANAAAAGGLAQQQQDQQTRQKSLTDSEDFVRSSASSMMSAPLLALAHHQPVGPAFDRAMQGIGDSLINKGVGGITDGLFGQKGQAGGGLFGGLINSLLSGHMFASGTGNAPSGPAIVGEHGPELIRMPAGAQVTPTNELGSMRAPAASHTFHIGGPTINVQGDVSEQNRSMIQEAVARGQQQTVEHITRNFGQIQSDAAQTA